MVGISVAVGNDDNKAASTKEDFISVGSMLQANKGFHRKRFYHLGCEISCNFVWLRCHLF